MALTRAPKNHLEEMMENQLWAMIRKSARTDEDLRELMNKVKMYWYIKYDSPYKDEK